MQQDVSCGILRLGVRALLDIWGGQKFDQSDKNLAMSEHQRSEDDLKLWMKNIPAEDLMVWLGHMQDRLQRMLDTENPLGPESKFEELGNLSEGYLFLAKCFLELANIANKARASMVGPSTGEDAERGTAS